MLALLLSLLGGLAAAISGNEGKDSASLTTTPPADPDLIRTPDPITAPEPIIAPDIAPKAIIDPAPETPNTDHGGHTPAPEPAVPNTGHDDGGHTPAPTPVASDTGNDGHGGHGGHDDGTHDDSALPTTQAEINDFVQMVRTGQELHVHGGGDTRLPEHTALLDLVDPAEATHIAIGHGSWFDPDNWHNGEVPGDDAKVVIPNAVNMTYDGESAARLFTVRVDGELDFATDTDSTMIVDTFIVSPTGTLTIGTEENPIQAHVDVDIIIANNGAIDVDWDPSLLSRGLISHGKAEIHGAAKDSHEKVIEDPMAGDTSVTFAETPAGWQVGDTIVVAGTRYEGYRQDYKLDQTVQYESQDEIRVITQIENGTVHFDKALEYDHDTPRADLHTSVANYTRNVSVETEGGAEAEVFERGHVMFMHSDDVDVRFAEFHELGRTDKSEKAFDASDFDNIAFDDNVKGRYGLHLHRLGTEDLDNPAIVVGNAVYGSPGWGFVHHDSNAILDNNASYNTFGAGFVSESGNETGAWTDNIAIYAEGRSWETPKVAIDDAELIEFDTGNSGDGFWFQSRMIESTGNIAASVNNGFVYFHRGPVHDNGQLTIDTNTLDFGEAFYFDTDVKPEDVPIRDFFDNEAFAAKLGLHVLKDGQDQSHDIRSTFDGFKAWNVVSGAEFRYTGHYKIENFDVVSRDYSEMDNQYPSFGIKLANEVSDFVIADATIDGFEKGLVLNKLLLAEHSGDLSLHDYFIVNTDITNSELDIENYQPRYDTILSGKGLVEKTPTLDVDGPLEVFAGQGLNLTGTKTDTLGTIDFPAGTDNHDLTLRDVISVMNENGYYETYNGAKYFTLDVYFSDRYTADVFKQTELVKINENVNFTKPNYRDVPFNGKMSLSELKALANKPAELVDDADAQTDVSAEFAIDTSEAHVNIPMVHTDAPQVQQIPSPEALWDALTKDQGTWHESDNEEEREAQHAAQEAAIEHAA